MRLAVVFAALAPLSLACGAKGAMTTHPTVTLDPAFTVAEVAQIRAGLDSWVRKGPDVRFTIATAADSASLGETAASGGAPDTIYVLRETTHSCNVTYFGAPGTPTPIAFTTWSPSGSTATCLDADRLDAAEAAQPNVFKAVAAHEIGHSLGLAHDDVGVAERAPESIMTTHHEDEPADGEVTCTDVRRVAAHFGVAAPAGCGG